MEGHLSALREAEAGHALYGHESLEPRHGLTSSRLMGFKPMYRSRLSGWGMRINFEGGFALLSGEPSSAYTQFTGRRYRALRVGILIAPKSRDHTQPCIRDAVVTYLQSVSNFEKHWAVLRPF